MLRPNKGNRNKTARTPRSHTAPTRREAFYRPALEALEDRVVPSGNPYADLANNLVANLDTLKANVDGALGVIQNVPFLDQTPLGKLSQAQVIADSWTTNLTSELQSLANANTNADSTLATWIEKNVPDIKQNVLNPVTVTSNLQTDTIEIDLWLHQAPLAGTQVPFDFGLKGLPFKASGQVDVNVGFDYELAFGYDPTDGFHLINKSLPNDPPHQLTFTASVSLSPNTNLSANFGILQGSIKDYASPNVSQQDSDPTTFSVGLGLADAGATISTPELDANIHLSLLVAGGFGSFDAGQVLGSWFPPGTTVQLPQLTAHFVLDWDFSGTTPDASALNVKFENVQLDLGSTLASFVQPLVSVVQDVLGPVEPILDLLTTPIPGISDLSHLVGGGDITLLSIAQEVLPQVLGPEVTPILDVVTALLPVIKTLDSIQGDRWVPIGDFNLDNGTDQTDLTTDAVDWGALTDVSDLSDSLTNLISSEAPVNLVNQLTGDALDTEIKQGLQQLATLAGNSPDKFQFDFPILKDPSTAASDAFKLFLGQDFDLFDFYAHFELDPVAGDIFGNALDFDGIGINFIDDLTITGGFHLAYDTYGIREFFAGGAKNLGDLLDGFYLDDQDTYLTFQGTIGPQLEGQIFPGISVVLKGQLETGDSGNDPFTIGVYDPNQATDQGKARLSSLFNQAHLFSADGEIDAGLDIGIKVGFDTPLGFVGLEKDFAIAQATLVNYPPGSYLGEGQPPVSLASLNGGVLTLNVAGVASYLQSKGASTETFQVKQVNGSNGPEVEVSALGYSQDFTGVQAIVANGAGVQENQDITIASNINVPATLTGGPQTNVLTYLGSATAILNADAMDATENSTLTGGTGKNILTGGAGTDMLIGGACKGASNFNILAAGSGTDQLYAGPKSSDHLVGGSGTATLYAGAGSDTMTGGSGPDTFKWVQGNGKLTVAGGGSGQNTLIVNATTAGAQMSITQDKNGDGGFTVLADGTAVTATLVQDVNMDDLAGHGRYTVNDLSLTPIQVVGVNLHESTADDGGADTVTVNGPAGADNVQLEWNAALAAQGQEVTQVTLSSTVRAVNNGNNVVTYTVDTAVPKPADTLNVNTSNNAAAVQIDSTQPNLQAPDPGGRVNVTTGAGNDTITVGDPAYGLDYFLGPLYVDAGKGHNQITFDESGSYVHDSVLVTATQVVRSLATAPVTVTTTSSSGTQTTRTETGYAFTINYKTEGDFTPVNGASGVIFKTSQGSTNLYIPEAGTAAPTEVDCDGGGWFGNNDDIVVGWNGLTNAKTHIGVAGSTIADLRSPLTVHGNKHNAPPATNGVLEVDDEGDLAKETYALGVTAGPPPDGVLQCTGAAAIQYDNVALTVNGGNHGSAINVTGVEADTTATFDAGKGTNTASVGDAKNTLDEIGGTLSFNGQAGTNALTINDQGDGFVNYTIDGPTGTSTFSSIADTESALIQFQNTANVVLNGAKSTLFDTVDSVPPSTQLAIVASGSTAILNGPGGTNAWDITGVNSGTLDASIRFTNIDNLTGGSGDNDFVFKNNGALTGISSFLIGGTGTNTLDFSQYAKPVGVTITGPGFNDGVTGGTTATGFSDISTIIGNAGSTLNASHYTGNWTADVRTTGFAPYAVNVSGDFDGSLVADALTSVSIGGNFGANAQIVTASSTMPVTVAGTTDPTAHVWHSAAGSFAVANGALIGQGASNLAILLGPSTPPPDLTLQATLTQALALGQSAALVGRYDAATNSMYLATLANTANGPVASIILDQNGQQTVLGSATAGSAAGTLTFVFNGASLELSLNGSPLLSVSDSTLSTGGAGVDLSNAVGVDDVTATPFAQHP